MSNWQKLVIIGLLVTFVACTTFVAGFGLGCYVWPAFQPHPTTVAQDQPEQFQVFWEAWHLIEEKFYTEKPLDYQEMTYGAIRGMVASLGDHNTVFLTPAQADMFDEDLQGEFGGIGVTVSMTEEGQLRVVKLIPGAPAESAGLKAGDVILEVDGKRIEDMDMTEAISRIRGPKGSKVRLLIQRLGDTFEVTIERAVIEIPAVESRMLDKGIAYLSLWECNARTAQVVRQSLEQLMQENPRGLILDLRGNPGGYLYVAERVASEFIDDGLILIERNKDGTEVRHEARKGGCATQIPLVVLVDKATASAAEIIAGAIQDNKRGILIGERTFGKGSVQSTERLSDRSSLRITIAHWLTPNGHQIDGQGLMPDIEVKISDEDLQAQRDPQLERAISYLLVQLSSS